MNNLYKDKYITADEAVTHIKSGNRVVIAHGCGEPKVLIDAMIKNKDNYKNVEIVHLVAMGDSPYAQPGMEPHFTHNAIFLGKTTRKAINEGRGDFTPCYFYRVPELFKTSMPVDVTILQVTPPDEHGYCSLGICNDYTKPAAENSKIVIAEVNDKMPKVLGDNFMHISDFDYLVKTSYEPLELQPTTIGPVEEAIGKNCASLINDGDTLQLGIGAIPDAVLLFLKHKKDLGIHSEMVSDGVAKLMDEGIITNKRKSIHKGKAIGTFLMGSKSLYKWAENNPSIELYSVDYVNNPVVIGQNDNMVSINSCLQVDLMGQVNAECMGLNQFSGVGGQVDFIRGAAMSKGGKSIIATPSTASKGKISRIVPFLDDGTAVTTSRTDVEYIVTEYGIANLKGKTLRERARALINIAHPDFRQQLINEYENRFHSKF